MMRGSRRARRLERNHRKNRAVTLSLVSLMDIFTILVFFLLVNSTEVEELPAISNIELPSSIAEARGRRTTILIIDADEIHLDSQRIAATDEALVGDQPIIPALIEPLKAAAAAKRLELSQQTEEQLGEEGNRPLSPLELTIMGDKAMPWPLLKRILKSCAEAGFVDISLAVLQKVPAESAGEGS